MPATKTSFTKDEAASVRTRIANNESISAIAASYKMSEANLRTALIVAERVNGLGPTI